jgi:hypothetical protein
VALVVGLVDQVDQVVLQVAQEKVLMVVAVVHLVAWTMCGALITLPCPLVVLAARADVGGLVLIDKRQEQRFRDGINSSSVDKQASNVPVLFKIVQRLSVLVF